VSWRGGRNLYADGFVLGQQAFFIREMTRRFADSPAVAGWLISNEMPLYGGPTTREYARAWGEICVHAVRAGGSDKPVSLGDGAWTREIVGRDNGFRLRDQLDVVDFFGPHAYPMSNDQIRQMTKAAFICELAHFGKPVVLEEFGLTSAFASETHAGHYYRQVLHHATLAGATGWIGWNNTDFELGSQQPYDHHGYELNFGVSTADGKPKAALLELAEFARVLDAVEIGRCARPDSRTAIVVPAFLDTDLPMSDDSYRVAVHDITHQSWIAARRAGLAPAIARESVAIGAADLILVPSNKALLVPTWDVLLERAAAGSHVYVGWFNGPGTGQRGAWWPHLEPLFGVRHQLRYGMSELAPDEVVLTVARGFGGLAVGDTFTALAGGVEESRAHLPIEIVARDVEVLLTDAAGQPALIRRPVGSGWMYLGTYPIEWFAAERRDGSATDPTPRLYAALAAEAGITAEVAVADDRVVVDALVRDDGVRFTWLVNLVEAEVSVTPALSGGGCLVDALTAEPADGEITLAPFGVRVLRHQR
jgi:endo-1,4-beta-mannosidase